jgi:hypothetical protein
MYFERIRIAAGRLDRGYTCRRRRQGPAAEVSVGSGRRGLLVRCPVAALVFEPCAEFNGWVGQRCDCVRGHGLVERIGLVAPAAEVAIGDLEEAGALGACDDRAEGGTEWKIDMGAGRAPTIAEPRAARDDPHEVMTEVPMAARDHPRVVLDIRGHEVGLHDRPFLADGGDAAVGVSLELDLGPLELVHRRDGLDQTRDARRAALGADVAPRILEPVPEIERWVGQRRDAARLDLAVVQRLLVAPAAELAEGQLPTGQAVRAGDDRAERRAERHVYVGSSGAPVATNPRTPGENEYEVIAAMAVPSYHHARVVVHVRGEKVGPHYRPLLLHNCHGAVSIALLLHGRPVDVIDVPKGCLDAVEFRRGVTHGSKLAVFQSYGPC